MNNGLLGLSNPDKRLAAVCGLFCPSGTLFMQQHVETDDLPGHIRVYLTN